MLLVTGGAGYIGSHLVRELHNRPYLIVDDLSKGHSWSVPAALLCKVSLLDQEALRHIFATYPITAVIHFAGRIEAGISVVDPLAFYQANVVGTIHLLEEMNRAQVRTIIFSSTAAVYGEPEKTPIDEEHPLHPENPYGHTKLAVEHLIAAWAKAHQGRYVALRYFNAAGAHPSGEIGEAHEPETHLIPKILDAAAGLAPEVKIFGKDYPTPDGTCIRDYIHVSDLAIAHLLALDHLNQGGPNDTFNLGNGQGFSVLEVIQSAERVTGKKIPYKIAPRRPGDPAVLVASSAKAKTALNWAPRWPELDTIIETAWRWHQKKT